MDRFEAENIKVLAIQFDYLHSSMDRFEALPHSIPSLAIISIYIPVWIDLKFTDAFPRKS